MTILHEILERKRDWLESMQTRLPLAQFQKTLAASDRNFAAALRRPSPAFILECKRASPSQGLIRDDFNLSEISEAYDQWASAISVLTESDYFQGSLDTMRTVRSLVSRPVLNKDFIFQPYQVYLARHFGADAILLILAILKDDQYQQLAEIAGRLEMDTITEVSNVDEQQRAIRLGAPIIGINNRDLRDFSINLETTRQLAGQLREQSLVISESGFYTHHQVREMSTEVDGFLIGSSLMAEPDLDLAARRLIFGENKVCGLTRNEDALAAADAGAVYGGLIFAEGSPRCISIEQAELVGHQVDLGFVGVFVDQSLETVSSTAKRLRLAAVQLHGNESPEFIERLRGELPNDCCIWKAVTVGQLNQPHGNWLDRVDRVLVDNKTEQSDGGTGLNFDWSQLPAIGREKMMIAGGLNHLNARQAAQLGAAGLDFNSGLEEIPGVKSHELTYKTFSQLREY